MRVLSAQLDLIASAVRSTRYTSPMWALALAWISSDSFGYLGHRPLAETILLPCVVAITMFLAANVVTFYETSTKGKSDYEAVRPWFSRMTALQLCISATWGLTPWFLWDPASPINHVFIAGATIAMLAGLVISRASHVDMLIASLAPIAAVAALRFVFGDTMLDYGIALFIPACAMQVFYDGRRLARRVDEDARLRFQVEDLPR